VARVAAAARPRVAGLLCLGWPWRLGLCCAVAACPGAGCRPGAVCSWVLAGGRFCAAAFFVFGSGEGTRWRLKPRSARRPMTATPSSAVYLLEGIIPYPFSLLSGELSGESFDLFGRTTTAPVASLPPWRCRLGNFAGSGGGGGLLSSESFRLCAYLCSFRLHRPGCNGRLLADALPPFYSLADTLPPCCSGGCFAAAIVLVITSGGCFAAVVGRVEALLPLSCC
jgi:hypothetical protein